MEEVLKAFEYPGALVLALFLFSLIIIILWEMRLLILFWHLVLFLRQHTPAIQNQVRVLGEEEPLNIYHLVDFFAKSIAPGVALLSFFFALIEIVRIVVDFTVFVVLTDQFFK